MPMTLGKEKENPNDPTASLLSFGKGNRHIFQTSPPTSLSHLPSTSDVSKVTLAALRLPAGRFSPILSSFSLRDLPPFLDFALHHTERR